MRARYAEFGFAVGPKHNYMRDSRKRWRLQQNSQMSKHFCYYLETPIRVHFAERARRAARCLHVFKQSDKVRVVLRVSLIVW